MNRTFALPLGILLLLGSVDGKAQDVATYNFFGNNSTTNPLPGFSSTASGWVASAITLGQGVNVTAIPDSFGGRNWAVEALANEANVYSFFLTNNSGSAVDLRSVTIRGNRESTGPNLLELRSGIDNFTPVGEVWVFTETTATSHTFTFDLPLSIANNDSIGFRLYGYNASSNGTAFWLDSSGNVPAIGVTPVPEPATILGLAVVGVLGSAGVRRLRHKSSTAG